MSSSPKYRIDFGQVVLNQIRVLAFRATRKRLLDPFTAALREMQNRLEVDPTVWGDPLYLYPVFGWLLYQRAVSPLHVSFGVDEARTVVYVKSVVPFPGGGLEAVS
jgi:hypothetical protein